MISAGDKFYVLYKCPICGEVFCRDTSFTALEIDYMITNLEKSQQKSLTFLQKVFHFCGDNSIGFAEIIQLVLRR